MIITRYKKRKKYNDYTVYLDIYIPRNKQTGEPKQRKYEFLNIYVSKDYSKGDIPLKIDKEKLSIIREIVNKRELEIIKGEYSANNQKKPLDDFFNYFDKTENLTVPRFFALRKHLHDFCSKKNIKKPSLRTFTTELCKEFQMYLFEVGLNQTTISGYMMSFKTFFNRVIKEGNIKTNPISFEIPRIVETKRTTLSLNEVKLLMDFHFETRISCPDVIRHAFLFSCFTGLRKSDVAELKWSDIKNNQIEIIQQKTRNKKPKYNYIPLNDYALDILEKMPKTDEKIFHNLPDRTTIARYLERWGLMAGIKQHIHFHCARHTFATISLTIGIDIKTLKELLGHSDIKMTEIYGKIVDEKKKFEMNKWNV